jgi:hypothetical protein
MDDGPFDSSYERGPVSDDFLFPMPDAVRTAATYLCRLRELASCKRWTGRGCSSPAGRPQPRQ